MPWVQKERAALVATLRGTDPDAATLCEGWDTRRLLAHLVQREHDLVAGIRDQVARAEPGQEPNLTRLTDAARDPEGYQALVTRFAGGPASWSPMSWAGESVNLVEYVIHHEDVRRAGPAPAEPRVLPDAEVQSVWGKLPLFARLAFSRSPVGVELAQPTGQTKRVKKAATPVTLTGEPVELALYVSGRRTAARVEVSGPPGAVETFEDWLATT